MGTRSVVLCAAHMDTLRCQIPFPDRSFSLEEI